MLYFRTSAWPVAHHSKLSFPDEANRADLFRQTSNDTYAIASFGIPKPNRAIRTAARKHLSISSPRDAQSVVGMPFELSNLFACARLEFLDVLVGTRRGDESIVGREGDGCDSVGMRFQYFLQQRTIRDIPDFDFATARRLPSSGDQPFLIAADIHGGNSVDQNGGIGNVADHSGELPFRVQIP